MPSSRSLAPQPADLFVHGGDAAIVVLPGAAELGIELLVFFTGNHRLVGGVEPDRRKEAVRPGSSR